VATKTLTRRPSLPTRLWRSYVTDVRIEADADSDLYRQVTPEAKSTRDMVSILVASALVVTIGHFAGQDGAWLSTFLRAIGLGAAADAANAWVTASQFNALAMWAIVQISSYVILPVMVIRLVIRSRLRDFGLTIRGSLSHAWVYALLLAISLVFIVPASTSAPFLAKYSFYQLGVDEPLWPYLWSWWILYALQFAALEFFFRGFMVHGLKLRLGYAAIFVMMVPYVMLHFQKPLLEALAAMFGAVVLGTLSLKTRSIWWGAALHISIAGTMDVLALLHKGLL